MAYSTNIPQPSDLLSVSQGDILDNFQALGNMMAPGGSTAGNGGYFKLTTANANPSSIADTPLLYSKDDGSADQLFFRRSTGDGGAVINCTAATAASNGSTNLPSGIIIKWGTAAIGTGTVVNFASAFPNNCYNVQVSNSSSGSDNHFVNVYSLTTASFTCKSFSRSGNADTSTIFYVAIGN